MQSQNVVFLCFEKLLKRYYQFYNFISKKGKAFLSMFFGKLKTLLNSIEKNSDFLNFKFVRI